MLYCACRSIEFKVVPASSSKVTELQAEHGEYLAQKRAEALDAVALMEEYAARKVETERANESA